MTSDGNLSAEQAKTRNIEAMGNELGQLYSSLWQELVSLHRKWGYFVQLFGSKQDRVELLNKTAPDLFRTIQDLLWEDALLHLARMTDAPKSIGKENLTIRSIPQLVGRKKLSGELESAVEVAVKKSEFARDWRNRRIAHRDLGLAVGNLSAEPLAFASRKNVDSGMTALGDVLNLVSTEFLRSTTQFAFAADSDSGPAISMLLRLRDGLEAEQAKRERVRSGDLLPGDLERRSI